MTVEDSRDGRLLRFEAETGEDGIVSTEVAAQLLLAEIDLSTFFGEKIKKPENVTFCHGEGGVGDVS